MNKTKPVNSQTKFECDLYITFSYTHIRKMSRNVNFSRNIDIYFSENSLY